MKEQEFIYAGIDISAKTLVVKIETKGGKLIMRKQISVSLEEALVKELKKEASVENRSFSNYVNILLTRREPKNQTVESIIEKRLIK